MSKKELEDWINNAPKCIAVESVTVKDGTQNAHRAKDSKFKFLAIYSQIFITATFIEDKNK